MTKRLIRAATLRGYTKAMQNEPGSPDNQDDHDAAVAREQLREHFKAEGRAITEREARTREEELKNPLWQTINDTIEDLLGDTPPVIAEGRTYESRLEGEEVTYTKIVRRREGQPYGGWGGRAFRKVLEEEVDTYVYATSGRTESKKTISLYDNDQGEMGAARGKLDQWWYHLDAKPHLPILDHDKPLGVSDPEHNFSPDPTPENFLKDLEAARELL